MSSGIRPTVRGYFIHHYLLLGVLSVLITAIGIGAVLGALDFMDSNMGVAAIVFAVVLISVALAHSKLHRNATSVYFDEDKMVYETGILSHFKKKIPIHMITDSSLKRSFIEKTFGVATLNISTSGSSGYEIVCNGLDYAETERMHDILYERIKKSKTEGRPCKEE